MENGVCCDEPTLLATLQVELFFNILVVVILRPGNRGSRRALRSADVLLERRFVRTGLDVLSGPTCFRRFVR